MWPLSLWVTHGIGICMVSIRCLRNVVTWRPHSETANNCLLPSQLVVHVCSVLTFAQSIFSKLWHRLHSTELCTWVSSTLAPVWFVANLWLKWWTVMFNFKISFVELVELQNFGNCQCASPAWNVIYMSPNLVFRDLDKLLQNCAKFLKWMIFPTNTRM